MKNQLNKLLVLSIISVIVSVGTLIYFIDTLPKKPATNVIAEDVEVVPVKSNLAVIKTVASIDQLNQDLLTSTSIVTDTKDEDNTDNKVEGTSEPVEKVESVEKVNKVDKVEDPEIIYNFDNYSKKLLLEVGYAEAGNQGVDGIGLVMQVIENRLESDRFPDTVEDILYQKNQFATASYLSSVTPTDDCYTAYDKFIRGEYKDDCQGATYFSSESNGWHDHNLKLLFQYKDHKFYTVK